MDNKIELKINKLEALISSYEEKVHELKGQYSTKRKEAENLFLGLEKYQDKPELAKQMESIIASKKSEIESLVEAVREITEKQTGIKLQLKNLYNEIKDNRRPVEMQRVVSPIIKPVIKSKPVETQNIVPHKKPAPKPKPVMNPTTKITPKTAKKQTLRDQALAEQAGQEAFYKSLNKGGKSYGAA